MEERHQERLRQILPSLASAIHSGQAVLEIAIKLNSKMIITDNMLDEIQSKPTTLPRVHTLVRMLKTREANAFDEFYEILISSGHGIAADLLKPDQKDERLSRMSAAQVQVVTNETGKLNISAATRQPDNLFSQEGSHVQAVDENTDLPPIWPIPDRCNKEYPKQIKLKHCYLPEIDRKFHISKTGDSDQIYKMASTMRGYCLVINNKNFSPPCDVRNGTEVDAEAITTLFTDLGFTVVMQSDLTSTRMLEVLKKFSTNADMKDPDCFVCFVLSHGNVNGVFGVDNVVVPYEELYSMVDGDHSRDLCGKPKLFFMQTCKSVPDSSNPVETTDSVTEVTRHPKLDFFISASTVPEFAAYRYEIYGTRFILTWVYVIEKYAHKYHVMDLARMVQDLMAKYRNIDTGCTSPQAAETTTRLVKDVYLFPGLHC